jgi:hypothetical protein
MAALKHKPQHMHMQQYAFFNLLETFSSRIPEKLERRKSKLYNNALGTAYKN